MTRLNNDLRDDIMRAACERRFVAENKRIEELNDEIGLPSETQAEAAA